MDFRKIFDSIPEEFDRWRPRYCDELFADLIEFAGLGPGKTVLEVGPGTGQATEPILKTSCDYTAIELGENLAAFMANKFHTYDNFNIINADFETHAFVPESFDLVYSAAAFQWIPEQIGYPKAFNILKSGGAFAMFMMRLDPRPGGGYTDEPLYSQIQAVYTAHFHPQTEYTCRMDYDARGKYGFADLERREYHKTREYDADGYIAMRATHSDHLTLPEPHKTRFYQELWDVIDRAGNKIALYDKIVMYLARKP